MTTLLRALALAILLVLTGCASASRGPIIGIEGPITVILMAPADLREACRALGIKAGPNQRLRGCMRPYGDPAKPWGADIWCGHGDAQCLAHELRHVVEPGWTHE